ncbi:MAG TPA: radical SAM protein [Desulfobulbus sp.]|nr:radical SAM protein [Desulfobulbus sp.]
MKHIFGPVNSRRLGRSLGVDLFSEKVCNLNCIYCEVGPTVHLSCQRAEYVPTREIIAEIDAFCRDRQRLQTVDVVTVTASGEPTLHAGFGTILAHLGEVAGRPIAVLTNGTTLGDAVVRQELQLADIVIPSLDSALAESFRKVDRPAACLDLAEIIEGLVRFSHEYRGQLWLEILFVRGLNEGEEDVAALAGVIGRMRLDRVQLNTVARPPLESFARPVDQRRLQEIAARFRAIRPGLVVDLLADAPRQSKEQQQQAGDGQENRPDRLVEIVHMVQRRPCTAADINRTFQIGGPEKVEQLLEPLVRAGRISKRRHGDRIYYH